ncbi:uncharacterized protein KIAA1755 homolog isoform X1 [Pogona vitticeps]
MDPQSLDAAVQNTLSGLFPPFDATAPTVLSQLFRVLEARYHGDGLCCLLDFLIPSKRLLEHVRQAACAPYISCVFLHEGWPLCLHEKVVVHLGPLNPLLLRPGDFYLQAEPCGEQSACLVVKCLSKDLTTVEEIPLPEASCSFLFTKEWLEEINQDLDRPALRTCLVATGNGIVPIPWGKIATPEFVDVPKIGSSETPGSSCCPEVYGKLNSQQPGNTVTGFGNAGSSPNGSWRPPQGKYPGLIKVEQGSWRKSTLFVVPSLCDIISENLEGEYVNLLGFSGEKDADFLAKSEAPSAAEEQHQGEVSPWTKKGLVCVNGESTVTLESWDCRKGPDSEEGPCTPCLRRKLSPDPKVHEPRCRYRDSYVAALKNPVNFSSGLMAAILEEIDVAQQVSHLATPDTKPPEGSHQAAPGVPPEHPKKDGKAEEPPKQGPSEVLKPPADNCPAASNRFSCRKGHRQLASSGGGPSGPEKAGKGQEGPRKKTLTVCSPRMGRGKAAVGKGSSQVDAGFSELPTLRITERDPANTSSTESLLKELLSSGSEPWGRVQWESLNPELLSSGVVCLPGNTDKLGRPIVQITTSGRVWQAPSGSAREVTQLLLHFCSVSRKSSKDMGLTILIDARKEPPCPSLSAALGAIQKALPGCIHAILLLAEKEAASHLERFPGVQVEVLSSLKALARHVDNSQLTPGFDGQFPYCHQEWIQYFQKFHPFVRGLTKASEVLQRTTRELEKENALKTSQAVEEQLDCHRQLMQEVLCDVQLMNLQREGGATLARLRKEAARLSFCPPVRNSMDLALGLYGLVEDEVHRLVAKSNSCLEHLQFLLKVRQLEAEFHKLSVWFDEEGEPELRGVGSAEGGREKAEESYRRFKEIFKEATVHYNHGLSLSKEAAKVQGSRFPELGAFEAAKRAFQAKLTTFYMAMQTKEAELETYLDLCRFSDKVTQFNLDCKEHPALRTPRQNEPVSPELQREAENLLRRLSGEFSAETFQQMKIQASSMCNGSGLAVWRETLERCQEAKQILEDGLARFKKDKMEGLGQGPAPEVSSKETCAEGPSARIKEREEMLDSRSRSNVGTVDRTGRHLLEGSLSGGLAKDVQESEETYLVSLGASLEWGGPETAEGLEPLPPTAENSPPASPAPASRPSAGQVPGACETLPPLKQPCASMPARGQKNRRKETTQYFQLSRHESFSSEDTDSQHSAEEALGSSTTLPVDLLGPKGGWAQEKAAGILYLENHRTSPLPHTAAQ